MVNWQSRLWKRWITKLMDLPKARRRAGGRRCSLTLERLEERLVPTLVQPPVAIADSASTAGNTAVGIDVLANDFDPDGTLDAFSLTVSSAPAHGTATVQKSFDGFNDNDSPVGDGFGSALSGIVDLEGHIKLAVHNCPAIS